jgi:hypothetical protein
MTAAQNQDFIIYAGDSGSGISPIFTVLGPAGTPIDISGVTEISWYARRNLDDAIVLTKLKSAGQITFVTSGVDGQFQVQLTAADTAPLSGWYMHFATLTGVGPTITTVEVGRMMVGIAPSWTWDPGQVGVEPLYTVRHIIGDTTQSDQLLTDQQIKWAVNEYSNEWLSAAECCRNIAVNFARQVDIGEGPMRKNYSQKSRQYASLARDLEQRGFARGGVTAYVGGVSITDKTAQVTDSDRVPPQFVIAMHDNLLPESPVGLQTNANLGEPQNFGGVTGPVP